MKIIAITNQKGGVGKTTTAVSLSAGLSKLGKKVLLIDTDSQCNATDTFNAKIDNQATIYDLLFENKPAEECIQQTPICDIIASDPLMKFAEIKFPNDASKFYILKEKMENIVNYDYIIIDTPPAFGSVLSIVLTYATDIIIPISSDRYGLAGVDALNKTIENIRKYTNNNLKIFGLLLIQHNERLNITKEMMRSMPIVIDALNTKLFDTKIRQSVSMRESQASKKTIFEYNETSTPAQDYLSLCKEIMEV